LEFFGYKRSFTVFRRMLLFYVGAAPGCHDVCSKNFQELGEIPIARLKELLEPK
jgi:hypothetical protein